MECGLLGDGGLIIGGDLNFTLSAREVWGGMARSDPLADYFANLLLIIGLVDLQPVEIL
jgi:hypothetical protein